MICNPLSINILHQNIDMDGEWHRPCFLSAQMRQREGGKMINFKTIGTITAACLIMAFQLSFGQSLENDEYSFQPREVSKARLYSLLATGIPVTFGVVSAYNGTLGTPELFLISGGLIVGPSVGYIYAGMNERGAKGIIYRSVLGAGAVLLGDQMGLEIDIFGTGEADDDGWPVAIFGAAFLIGHAINDGIQFPTVVRKRSLGQGVSQILRRLGRQRFGIEHNFLIQDGG
jgi:hypothetical protein